MRRFRTLFAAMVLALPAGALAATDLTVTWTSGPVSAASGAAISIGYTVRNSSGVNWPPFIGAQLGAYLSGDSTITTGDTRVGTTNITLLLPGAQKSGTVSATIPAGTAPGRYYVGLFFDYANDFSESNESNNATPGQPFVVGPELSLSSLAAPAVVAPGATVPVNDTVVNGGSASAATQVGFYLSQDSTITTSDTPIGTRTVPAIMAGGSSVGTGTNVTLPPGLSGTWYLGAIVDPSNQVAEADETNNARAVPIYFDAACSCSLGICTYPQGTTRYCYDGAGNMTARFVAAASATCVPMACP